VTFHYVFNGDLIRVIRPIRTKSLWAAGRYTFLEAVLESILYVLRHMAWESGSGQNATEDGDETSFTPESAGAPFENKKLHLVPPPDVDQPQRGQLTHDPCDNSHRVRGNSIAA
jgi:hypothetical protein